MVWTTTLASSQLTWLDVWADCSLWCLLSSSQTEFTLVLCQHGSSETHRSATYSCHNHHLQNYLLPPLWRKRSAVTWSRKNLVYWMAATRSRPEPRLKPPPRVSLRVRVVSSQAQFQRGGNGKPSYFPSLADPVDHPLPVSYWGFFFSLMDASFQK